MMEVGATLIEQSQPKRSERDTVIIVRSSAAFAWLSKGFFAVLDQGLFAGSNFLVSVLLARWLEPGSYGAFSVAYSALLLLGTVHTALWTEPMMVFGSGRFREAIADYRRVLVRYHWSVTGVLSGALLVTALGFALLKDNRAASSLSGLAVAIPTVFYLWLMRRSAYVTLEPKLAAYGGAFYLALYIGIAVLLRRVHLLNEATAFFGMACAALLSAEGLKSKLGFGRKGKVDPTLVRTIHWEYGRWAILSGTLSWVSGHVYYLILSLFHGLEASAGFKAIMNVLMPIVHFNGALAQLLLPRMVDGRVRGRRPDIYWRSLVIVGFVALMYWAFLGATGPTILEWLYSGRYAEVIPLLPWLGLMPVFNGVASVTASLLRAEERPQGVTIAYGLSAGVATFGGTLLLAAMGIRGAAFAIVLANMVSAFALWWLARGTLRDS